MHRRFEAFLRLADLAGDQWGLFTAAQAHREGVSAQGLARLAKTGRLERIRHGVYRIVGTPPGQWDRLQAAWLSLQPELTPGDRLHQPAVEVVSHRSAAQLHRIGDLDADRMEFLTPVRRQTRDPDVRLRRGTVPPHDRTVVDGLPVTTPLRTIVDLASVRLDGGHLAGVVRDAVTTLHLDPDLVSQALRPYAHRYGLPLGDGQGFLIDLLQQAGIPKTTSAAADALRPVTSVSLAEAIRVISANQAQLAEALRPERLRGVDLPGATTADRDPRD